MLPKTCGRFVWHDGDLALAIWHALSGLFESFSLSITCPASIHHTGIMRISCHEALQHHHHHLISSSRTRGQSNRKPCPDEPPTSHTLPPWPISPMSQGKKEKKKEQKNDHGSKPTGYGRWGRCPRRRRGPVHSMVHFDTHLKMNTWDMEDEANRIRDI